MAAWKLQDAKNRFSALVREAVAGYPQHVTRRGKPAVVVLAAEEYERLTLLEEATAPTLPEVLLAIPGDGREFERSDPQPRPVEFDRGRAPPADTGG